MRRVCMALFALMLLGAAAMAETPMPEFPWGDSAYALSAPVMAQFAEVRRYDVYSGPGEQYYREADGKAVVSTNGWIAVFGEEDGWLLICYRVNEQLLRFGYIRASAEEAGVSVSQLMWRSDPVQLSGGMTSDPLTPGAADILPDTWEGTLLASLGTYAYVQTQMDDGVPLRAFVALENFSPVVPEGAHQAMLYTMDRSDVLAYFEKEAALAGDMPDEWIVPGQWVIVLEEEDGLSHILTQVPGEVCGRYWVSSACLVMPL